MKIYFELLINQSSETNPLELNSEWKEASPDKKWSRKATIKIFNDENEYNEYQNEIQNDDSSGESE